MDLQEHLDSYRASIKKDALKDCIEYARASATADPANFPTVYDYINHSLNTAIGAVKRGDEALYRQWLPRHQEAMLALFERMVDVKIGGADGYTPKGVFDLIYENGWNWFKFASRGLVLTLNVRADFKPELFWIPRYAPKFDKARNEEKGRAVFDADEMKVIFEQKPSHDTVHTIIRYKQEHRELKYLSVSLKDEAVFYKPINKINEQGLVNDWSLPLFQ